MPREADQAFWSRGQRLQDALVQADPDGELDEHRAEAAQRVYAVFTVEPHRLLRLALPVIAVFGLNLLHLGLQRGHRFELAALLHRQRDHDRAYHQREDDNGQSEVAEEDAVQQQKAVDHRLDEDQVPDVNDYGQSLMPLPKSSTACVADVRRVSKMPLRAWPDAWKGGQRV